MYGLRTEEEEEKGWKDNRGGRKTGKSGGRTRKVKGVEEEVGTGVERG